ncbi:hypothetical protein C5167_013397 [Papaver somniferum]|uniref:Uncharacterized protein n=1 Tax=Papaver somniferum TaxID=3469 RepID=A0A4Y7J069_PAPSO|nr:hypothetical protein C5167_013397 [Papaver somniferum]
MFDWHYPKQARRHDEIGILIGIIQNKPHCMKKLDRWCQRRERRRIVCQPTKLRASIGENVMYSSERL